MMNSKDKELNEAINTLELMERLLKEVKEIRDESITFKSFNKKFLFTTLVTSSYALRGTLVKADGNAILHFTF